MLYLKTEVTYQQKFCGCPSSSASSSSMTISPKLNSSSSAKRLAFWTSALAYIFFAFCFAGELLVVNSMALALLADESSWMLPAWLAPAGRLKFTTFRFLDVERSDLLGSILSCLLLGPCPIMANS